MSNDWYYRLPGDSAENGPVPFDDLQQLGASGELPRNSLVREGTGAWRVASSLVALWEASAEVATSTLEQPVAAELVPAESVATESVPAEPDVDEPEPEYETANSLDDLQLASDDEPEPTEASSLDDLDLKLVDESPEDSGEASLDDLGMRLVDEADSPPVRMQRRISRVVSEDEWTDPDAFRVEHVAPQQDDTDRSAIDDDLKELAGAAFAGSDVAEEVPEKADPGGEYFVKVDGTPHGPIDFPTLRTWAEEGRVIEEDEIKLPGADIWLPASALAILFEGISPAATPEPKSLVPSAASVSPINAPTPPATPEPAPANEPAAAPANAAAAAALSSMTPPPPTSTPAPATPAPAMSAPPAMSSGPAAMGGSSHPAFSAPASTPAKKPKKAKIASGPGIGSAIAEFFGSLMPSGGGGSSTSPVIIGVLVVVALVLGWIYMPGFDGDGGTYETLIAHYTKSVQIRQDGGNGWDGFASDAAAEVQAIHEELKKTASAKEPEKQRMLWASDAMVKLLNDKKLDVNSERDKDIRAFMAFAREKIGDESLPPVPLWGADGDEGTE